MLERFALDDLATWNDRKRRKPLVVRGARQVGKSVLVKMFAKKAKLDLMEINLELREDFIDCFS